MTDESGRPGTLRSKVGCDAIDEPCTNRIVPFSACPAAGRLRHKNSRTSPFIVQCSIPGIFIFPCKGVVSHYKIRACLGGGRNVGKSCRPGYVSEAADAQCPGPAGASGDPRERSGHLADLELAAV